MTNKTCVIGVSDHAGWAVTMTVTKYAEVIDRRNIELVDEGLTRLPHKEDGQRLPIDEAVELVRVVRENAEKNARLRLDEFANTVPLQITGIALRVWPALPMTVAERITNQEASGVADWAMYREALAAAAVARGWNVHWFKPRLVFDEGARKQRAEDLDDIFKRTRKAIGGPWTREHRLAMAAALAAQ